MSTGSFFYADAVYGARKVALLAGPFLTEAEARAALPAAKSRALDADPRMAFSSFGTCSFAEDRGPGHFNEAVA